MTREEQLAYCTICQHRSMDLRVGLLCGLTNKKADFAPTCEKFLLDKDAEVAEYERKLAATGDDTLGDPKDYAKNKQVGGFVFLIGWIVFLFSYVLAPQGGVYIIPFGAILYGGFQYMRGVEQEKVAKEQTERKSRRVG